jgi:lysyl-tRNA synthetase class 2
MRFYRQTVLRSKLEQRARILQAVREFFVDRGFLEIETPIRIPAPIPEAHIEVQVSGDWYLHPSPELCMKRLLAAGYGKIFQICRCFRKGERGDRHVPEMTLLEWYVAGWDYLGLMTQCESLICCVAERVKQDREVSYQGRAVDLTPPWERITVADAFDRFGSMPVGAALKKGRYDEIMGLEIEPNLGLNRPVFLHDYPAQCGSLARLKHDNPTVAERFELYIAGIELCNAFSELTDAEEQRARFEEEARLRETSGKKAYPKVDRFLDALDDLPDAAGNAMGLDRLVMLFTDSASIDDVTAFIPEEL